MYLIDSMDMGASTDDTELALSIGRDNEWLTN